MPRPAWQAEPNPEISLRHFLFPLIAAFIALALPVYAKCTGTDLFAALPAPEQARLRAAANAVPHAEGLIFRATKGAQEITLAGTYHLPDPRHDALLAELAPVLKRASVLLVEAGPEEQKHVADAVAANPGLMFSASGPTLPDILPQKDWAALSALFEKREMPPFLGAKMKPFFVLIVLAIPPCAMSDLQEAGGLDQALMEKAQDYGVPIAALEPWDTALTLFDTITPSESASFLRSLQFGAEDSENMAVTQANLYFAREPRIVLEFGTQRLRDAAMPEEEIARVLNFSGRLVTDTRNHAWVPVLERAAEKGPVLAAFGALHLSGDQGVLALLERNGWRIERLD